MKTSNTKKITPVTVTLVLLTVLAAYLLARQLGWVGQPDQIEFTPDDPLFYSYILRPVISNAVPARASDAQAIRVASYNIEHLTDGVDDPDRTPERLAAQVQGAAAIISEINPDIIVLQEIENKQALGLLNNALPKPFPFGYITFVRHSRGSLEPLNIAALSRFPLNNARATLFTPANLSHRPARGFLAFELDLGSPHRLLVYAIHLKSNFGEPERNQRQRMRALELLRQDAEHIAQSYPDYNFEILVLGDTNVDPENPEFAGDPSLRPLDDFSDLWRGRPIAERTTIATRHGDPELVFPPAAFDRIFAGPSLSTPPWTTGPAQVLQKGTCTTDVTMPPGEGGHVSDHYPVFVDVTRE